MKNPKTARERSPHLDPPNFDRLAKIYRWMEYLSFGPMLERCRFRFIRECSLHRHALVLGDGDGRFTARLLRINPFLRIDAVDASAAMLAELTRRVQYEAADASQRLSTIHADLRTYAPDSSLYDLVVSHFFLDCLTDEELERMIARIVPYLTPDASWVISEFSIPKQGFRRQLARTLVRFLYFAFEKMTHLDVRRIPDYAEAMTKQGFHVRCQVYSLGGLLVAEMWDRKIPQVERRS